MKNLILITLFLMPFLSVAQSTKKPIDSFLGIKLGSSVTQVKTALQAKGGKLDLKNSKPDYLLFEDISLGQRKSLFFVVKFVDNKAAQAAFFFTKEHTAQVIPFYEGLAKDLNEVYGDGKSVKNFKSPYKDGDGHEETAIQTANAEYTTYWSDEKNTIILSISTDMQIMLTYLDGALTKIATERDKEKNKSEF